MARIGVLGFLHETNTFAPGVTELDCFLAADAWPGLIEGDAIINATRGMNLAISGFIHTMRASGHDIVPLLWCSANPSGPVSDDAFSTIAARLESLLEGLNLDGLFLDLHGSMVTQSLDDAEGELLKRLRRITGPNVHYVAALDFHAIVTQDMVDHTQAMVAYQSYPHVDMAQTGERAANLMRRILAGETFFPEWRKLNFLVSMPWQSTLDGAPAGEIINYAHTLKTPDCPEIQFVPGFPLSDTPQSGPCVLAYSRAVESARLAVQKLAERIEISRGAFHGHLYTPANAVDYVHSHPEDRIILADTQDNPGGGAAGDSTEIARALLAGGVKNACVALVCDPDFAKAAHANGCSTRFRAPLGGKSHPGEQPLYESFQILALGDGKIVGTGPFYKGCHMELGPMVRVQTQGIDILVSSRKQQAADQAMFKHLGVSPSDYRVLALKSSVHFRADFAHLADQILMVKAIGANVADLHDLVFRRLRPGVEIL